MSKDFEAEYREYQKQSVPDLWSRIESGIDAEEAKKPESKKVVKFPIWKMATIAAACFAVIICIPSLGIMMFVSGGTKSADTCTTADCTTTYEEECTSEPTSDYAEDGVADCVTESATEVTEDYGSMFDAESEVNLNVGYSEELQGSKEETVEQEMERECFDIRISDVEELEDIIRYTATNLETEEEVVIMQEPDMPRMKVGNNYPVCVLKSGDIYYFEALVVE